MGYSSSSYKILSEGSGSNWNAPRQQQVPQFLRSKPQRVLDFVKKWLLCGWNENATSTSNYSNTSPGSSRDLGGSEGYVQPPKWKKILRRVKAKSKKVHEACCEGLCFHPQQQPLNYHSTDSYEKNFDRGREYWQDGQQQDSQEFSKTFAAPPSYKLHSSGFSVTPILWEEEPSSDDILRPVQAPIWQRRMMGAEIRVNTIAVAAG